MEGFSRQNGFFGLSGLGPASGSSGPTPTTLEQLQTALSGDAVAHIHLPTRLSTCWTDDGITQATAGQSLYRVDDLSGNDHHLYQTGGSSIRPKATDGMDFDGLDDWIGRTFGGGAGPTAARVIFAIKTTDTAFYTVTANGSTPVAMLAQDGNAASSGGLGGGTILADGVSLGTNPTRDVLCDAISTGAWVIVVVRTANLSTYPTLAFGGLSQFLDGAIGGSILFNEASVSDDAATEALAIQLLQEELGL